MILRKAKAFKKTLENMTIYIEPDSLIVGNQASRNFAAPVFPEYSIDWIIEEMDEFALRSGDSFDVDEDTKERIRKIAPYWMGRTHKDEVLKPVTQDLYYKVDSTLTKTSDNNGGDVFALTNNKGVSCSVRVTIDNTSSSDHIKDYFSIKESQLLPTYNDNGDVVDVSAIPLFQEGSIKINNVIWYYMNVYYRKNPSDNYTALRHRFLSAGHNGVFYNLELSNFDDLNECNLTLDSFLRSLQFIDL